MSELEVFPYTTEILRAEFARHAHPDADVEALAAKRHHQYLNDYLGHLKVKSFLVETEYIDRDYLEDHAGYYVRCFREYPRFCSRVHFFGEPFTQEEVAAIVGASAPGDLVERFRSSYCGFLVIRPLPERIVGRTCLKTYPQGNGGQGRAYPALVEYEAHVAGLTLTVPSVAYQEQDVGVAACATSALWSAFHITGRRFQHPILSPVAITQAATETGTVQGRVFPSPGLSIAEMCLACHKVSLETEVISLHGSEDDMLPGVLYGYLRGGLPVILLIELVDQSVEESERELGMHAVTVCGFNLSADRNGILTSSRVDKLYAHDDQVGPFARMELARAQVWDPLDQDYAQRQVLTTSWPDSNGKDGSTENVVGVPVAALVPVYHKIRVGAPDAMKEVMVLAHSVGTISKEDGDRARVPTEWDLKLQTVSELKESWRRDNKLAPNVKAEVLPAFLPRFIWSARGLRSRDCVFEVLFDATDTSQGVHPAKLVPRDVQFTGRLQTAVRRYRKRRGARLPALLEWFAKE